MKGTIRVLEPTALPGQGKRGQSRRIIGGLDGKVVGFIDNSKLNFNHLVDDLADLLVSKYGVARIVKHRKPGQVPVTETVLREISEQCDVVITGSGD